MKTVTTQIAAEFRANACGVYPEFVGIAGAQGGVVLSHLFLRSDCMTGSWISTSLSDIIAATGMSKAEATRGINRLQKLGLLESCPEKGYRLDMIAIAELLR